jgi:endonuclease YncB( thermonuclease family)
VVDGDTLRLSDGRSVRMIGLNAPETGKKGRPTSPLPCRRQRLQALVAPATGGRAAAGCRQDRYGRTLAHVYGANGAIWKRRCWPKAWAFRWRWRRMSIWSCQQAPNSVRDWPLGLWRQSPVLKAEQISVGFRRGQRSCEQGSAQSRRNLDRVAGGAVVRIAPKSAQFDRQRSALQGKQVEARGWVLDRSRRAA